MALSLYLVALVCVEALTAVTGQHNGGTMPLNPLEAQQPEAASSCKRRRVKLIAEALEEDMDMRRQLKQQEEKVAEVRASNAELKQTMTLVQSRMAAMGEDQGIREMVEEQEDTVAKLSASNLALRRELESVQEALKGTSALLQDVAGRCGLVPGPPAREAPVFPGRMSSAQQRTAMSNELINAAECGDVEEVRQLLQQGADVTYKGREQRTALHFAALNGHVAAMRALIDSGAPVDAGDDQHNTAINYAAWKCHVTGVKVLAAAGADVDKRNKWGYAPLHNAAFANIAGIGAVRALLAAGADPKIRDQEGRTARDVTSSDAVQALLLQ